MDERKASEEQKGPSRAPEQASASLEEKSTEPRRARRGRKRTRFAIPQRPAPSVKALWSQASDKDRERAHRYGMAILETWLGKKSRQRAAEELGLPVLRVWQLSQQAVSGMLAGLLTQPRTRRSPSMPPLPPEQDPKVLLRRIAKLERELEVANELIEVLKLLPDRPSPPMDKAPASAPKGSGKRPRTREGALAWLRRRFGKGSDGCSDA